MGALPTYKEKFARLVADGSTYAEALRKSHPKAKKWKDNTVWINSSRLMADVKVRLRVEQLQAITAEQNAVTIEEVLKSLAKWIRFNPKSIINDDGSMKSFSEMSDDEAECVQDFQIQEIWGGEKGTREVIGVLKRVKLIDKLGTADKFMRKFGQYINNLNITNDNLEHLEDLLDGIK